jgi:putative redox protein
MPTVATWIKDMEFRVDYPQGESLVLASVPGDKRPGPGPSPMEAVLAALSTCTGMDVVHILGKMRKTLTSLRITVNATRRDEHPRVYTRLQLTYHAEGPDLDAASVLRAVKLSHDTYCSVSAMLEPTVKLDYAVVVNGEPVG